MKGRTVFVVGAARTAIGAFQGMYSSTPAPLLGAAAIKEAVRRSTLPPEVVQEVFMGCVLTGGQGQAPARQASIFAGLPKSVPCTTVGKVCGSGAQAIILGARTIALEENDVVVAGGMENMTLAPYSLLKARAGYRLGNGEIIDEMVHDGLWDPYNNFHMGMAAELCADKYKFTRQMQDDFAVQSYKRALTAIKEGYFDAEIVSVIVKDKKKGDVELRVDEGPARFEETKMRALPPAFKKDGTVTAGNASSINDGAAALVLASDKAVKEYNLKPMGRIIAWGTHAQEPEWFTTAPVEACRKTLRLASMKPSDIELWEVNEAFAVVAMVAIRELEIPNERINIHGGAVSLGHPIGCSGARIMVTLLHAMERVKAKTGLGTMCIGGGEAIAIIFEKC